MVNAHERRTSITAGRSRAAQDMRERRSPIWRRILSWVFLILFCLAVPVALVTGWARLTVVNEDVYVQTVGAAADDPRVQLGVSRAVTTRVEARLAGENPSATEALQSRVVAEALGEVTRGVVASEEFRQTWEEANREAHRFLASELAAGTRATGDARFVAPARRYSGRGGSRRRRRPARSGSGCRGPAHRGARRRNGRSRPARPGATRSRLQDRAGRGAPLPHPLGGAGARTGWRRSAARDLVWRSR